MFDGRERIPIHDPELLAEYCFVSPTAVRSVLHNRGTFLLNEVESDLRLASDEYIAARRPRAIACAPVKEKGGIVCLIYLENDLQAKVFTPVRQQFLEMLAEHLSCSLMNAKIYGDMKSASEASGKFIPVNLMQLLGCMQVCAGGPRGGGSEAGY